MHRPQPKPAEPTEAILVLAVRDVRLVLQIRLVLARGVLKDVFVQRDVLEWDGDVEGLGEEEGEMGGGGEGVSSVW